MTFLKELREQIGITALNYTVFKNKRASIRDRLVQKGKVS